MSTHANRGSTGVTILGSTGTIGASTLDVLARHSGRYHVVALSACRDVERLFAQCRTFQPAYAVLMDEDRAEDLRKRIAGAGLQTEVLAGLQGLETVAAAPEAAVVMAAIVGAAGLLPTLAAVRAGKRVLLANKEALVMAGPLFMNEVRDHGAQLLPIDSEHNAVFQCLPPHARRGLAQTGVERILLTASGGPFRETPLTNLAEVTPEQACAHPQWTMGRKISVDSASMMNKGLEVIEACWLFDARVEQIEVVVHPQSIVHSLVAYTDGSVLAQLGNPDMRTPIAHALAWPERISSGVESLNLFAIARLDFHAPDIDRYPCLRLAYEAQSAGGTATAVLNAANEVAVQAFLDKLIPFTDVPRVVEHALGADGAGRADSLDKILSADRDARATAREFIARTVRM